MASTPRPSSKPEVLRFGDFKLDLRVGELHRNGSVVHLQRQPFQLLTYLAENAGQIVAREELRQRLWHSDTFVDFDNGLNTAINKIREALGDSAESPRFVETLPRRGYRFIASIDADHPTDHPVLQLASNPESTAPVTGVATRAGDNAANVALPVLHTSRLRYVVFAALLLSLVLLAGKWRTTNAPQALVIERRITANPPEAPITAAVISPDGKYVAYSDPTGIYIHHLASGETHPLQLPNNFDALPTSWFPDSTHLLLAVGGNGKAPPGLWKVSILGGNPQSLIENAMGGAVSPDGSKIAFWRSVLDNQEIWIANSDGQDSKRIVATAGPGDFAGAGSFVTNPLYAGGVVSRLAWSPSGIRIAYVRSFWPAYPDPALDNKYALETIDITGGAPRTLKESAQLRPALCWVADGRLLYASRDDAGSDRSDVGVWSLRVNQKSGEPDGDPVQVSQGVGRVGELSVSADGKRLVLWRVNTQPEVFITELDREGRSFKTPRRLTLDENLNVASAWTPEGHAVLFASNRSGTWKLFRQDIDQPAPEVLAEGGRNFIMPRLNPDGTQVLYLTGYNPEDPEHLVGLAEVPLQGGSPRTILRLPSLGNLQCAKSPSKVCVLSALAGTKVRFATFDEHGGAVRDFATLEVRHPVNWSLSPDGSQLAFAYTLEEPKIAFMTIGENNTHEVKLDGWVHLNTIDWTAGGKSVYVVAQNQGGTTSVLEVEPSGNYRVMLEGNKNTRYWWAIQSPDRRHVLLEQITGENNVWMVERF